MVITEIFLPLIVEVCYVKVFFHNQVFAVAAVGHSDLNLFEKQHGGGSDPAFSTARIFIFN